MQTPVEMPVELSSRTSEEEQLKAVSQHQSLLREVAHHELKYISDG